MKHVFGLTLALALLASAPALAQARIDVMTQNQYLGADLNPIIAAPDAPAFNAALIVALQDIAANDYPARSKRLAELIADRLPDLAGLQEMFAFQCTDLGPPTPGAGCDDPSIRNAFNDHLEATLFALAELDEPYVDVATVNNLDLTGVLIPGLPPGLPVDLQPDGAPDITVTVLDRDVILARLDIAQSANPPTPVTFPCTKPSVDGCNFQVVASANSPLGPISIERGFVGVDAIIGGTSYRFVNTHLEVQRPDGTDASSIVQALQAAQLIQTLGTTPTGGASLIVVGDINSSSEDPIIPGPWPSFPHPFDQAIIPPYTQFVASGYADAWDGAPDDQPGFSCCQLDDLSNQQSSLDERIDVIFSIEVPTRVKKARVLGAKVSDRTPPAGLGLWPSDHGSVAAELQFD